MHVSKTDILSKLILLLLIFTSTLAFGQPTDDSQLVELFAKDVKNSKKDIDKIVRSYLCDFGDEKYQDKFDLTVMQLAELRKMLKNAKVKIQPYSEVPPEEQTIQGESPGNVYRILANGKHVCFVLINGDKIVSFSTMRKGDEGSQVFISFCE